MNDEAAAGREVNRVGPGRELDALGGQVIHGALGWPIAEPPVGGVAAAASARRRRASAGALRALAPTVGATPMKPAGTLYSLVISSSVFTEGGTMETA